MKKKAQGPRPKGQGLRKGRERERDGVRGWVPCEMRLFMNSSSPTKPKRVRNITQFRYCKGFKRGDRDMPHLNTQFCICLFLSYLFCLILSQLSSTLPSILTLS
ncbi:hypothetical protein VNO78_23048 [Psophocarpus tetragonolobus]|uniref:Uncharacterized protein n=1 Tax=Psophocarpus tetragonolobus TaxID=3891 RepID=A0AAN9S3G3_PSOTE